MVSSGRTVFQSVQLCAHLVSFGCTSVGTISTQLVSQRTNNEQRETQYIHDGKRKGCRNKNEKGKAAGPRWICIFTLHPERARWRTKRTETVARFVSLNPPNLRLIWISHRTPITPCMFVYVLVGSNEHGAVSDQEQHKKRKHPKIIFFAKSMLLQMNVTIFVRFLVLGPFQGPGPGHRAQKLVRALGPGPVPAPLSGPGALIRALENH